MKRILPPIALVGFLFAALAPGCADPAVDYGDPAAKASQDFEVVPLAPLPLAVLDEPTFDLRARVVGQFDSGHVWARRVGDDGWVPLAEIAGEFRAPEFRAPEFRAAYSLVHGEQWIELRAQRADGIYRGAIVPVHYKGPAPGLRVSTPLASAAVLTQRMVVAGLATAQAPARVTTVQVELSGAGVALPAAVDGQGYFSVVLDWPFGAAGDAAVTVRATDDAGRTTAVSLPVRLDAQAPSLTLLEPAEGAIFAELEAIVAVRGEAQDDVGMAGVFVGIAGQNLARAVGHADFEAEVKLGKGRGHQTIEVRAVDAVGRTTSAYVQVEAPREVVLHLPEPAPTGPIDLSLTRADLESVLPEEGRHSVVLFCLNMREVVKATVQALQDPAALGMSMADWPQLATNLMELLSMTPSTARFEDTSLQRVMDLSAALGISPPSLLSTLLQRSADDRFLSSSTLVAALMDRLVLTHPSLQTQGFCGAEELGITLEDALSDMATLERSLGEWGEHPGLVAGPPSGSVLTSGTLMEMRAYSQLVAYEGVDLQSGFGRFFRPAGGESALRFALDERFSIEGLPSYPRVDLPFRMTQAPGWVPGGQSQGLPSASTPFPRGDGPAWSLAHPWWLEGIVADSAWREYRALWAESDYAAEFAYDVGDLKPAARIDWERGWLEIETQGNLGEPPPPAYLWDTLLEVAQTRLRDGIGELADSGDVILPLAGIPMPVTAEQVRAQVPDLLQQQQAALSDLIAGGHAQRNSPVDFVLIEQGGGIAMRAIDAEWAPAKPLHPKGGAFYSDAALAQKLGASVPLALGQTLFMVDEGGAIWAIQVVGQHSESASLAVRRAGQVAP